MQQEPGSLTEENESLRSLSLQKDPADRMLTTLPAAAASVGSGREIE